MVADAKELNELEQAVFFHARERRRSLAGIVQLYRTAQIFGPTMAADLADALFSTGVDQPITFQTAIAITGPAPSGLVFGYGNATGAVGLCLNASGELELAAGNNVSGQSPAAMPQGGEFDIVASVRPGPVNGHIRVWVNGRETIRATSSAALPNWANTGADGDFARAASGALTNLITEQGALSDFEVIEPLSVYLKQFPRHFAL